MNFIYNNGSLKGQGTLKEPRKTDLKYRYWNEVKARHIFSPDEYYKALNDFLSEQADLPEYIVVGEHSWKDGDIVPETAFEIQRQLYESCIGWENANEFEWNSETNKKRRVVAIPITKYTSWGTPPHEWGRCI